MNRLNTHTHTQSIHKQTYPKQLDLAEDTVGIDQIAKRIPNLLDGYLPASQL